jgi:molybdenum-dependent DNA-binding transcriptional regulator ModE
MLDVRRLKVLREVAQTGSFSAAAESLAFTQPAVSRQIATLEAEAGTRLVERSARGVRLTQAGELLVGHADAILDRLTAAENQLEALNSLAGGRLHIGATATANATLIPTLALATVREDIVLRSLKDAPRRTISIATLGCGYEAPAVEPMRAVLRRVAEEHCFSCDACVS